MPLRAPVGDQLPPLTGSSKKVICRRAPIGMSTTCSWLVLPNRVLIVRRPSGVQLAKDAPREYW